MMTFIGRKSKAFQSTAEQGNKKQIGQNKSIPESWRAGVQRGVEKTERLQLDSHWYHALCVQTYKGLFTDQTKCIDLSFLVFFLFNSHTVFLLWYFLLKGLRQPEKKLFFFFSPICSSIIKKIRREQKGIQISKLSSSGGYWSMELVCHLLLLGKVCSQDHCQKQPCLYNKPGGLLYFQSDAFFHWIKY